MEAALIINTPNEREVRPAAGGGFALRPVSPGRTLAAELEARGTTANALALKLRVPANRITEIIRGNRAISAETALRLGHAFGNGAEFWLRLQANYDLATARREHGADIEHEVEKLDA